MLRNAIDPRQFYLDLCKQVTDELMQQLLGYMINHGYIGHNNRVTRGELATALLGVHEDRTDRMIRKAKEELTRQGVPILSSSGTAGYYLAEYQDEIDEYIRENNNRIQSLHQQNSAASKVKLPYLPSTHTPQPRLFEELV
jgi:hypothetical protein